MFFKNATYFRFNPEVLAGQLELPERAGEDGDGELLTPFEEALRETALKPVGPLEFASHGFVSPYGRASEMMAMCQGKSVQVCVGTETKILPPSVVNDALLKKIAEFEATHGRRPGGKMRKQLKEEIVNEMLPKAMVKPGRVNAIINTEHGFVAVNTASRKVAEGVISEIRRALGSFPALPLNAEVAPRAVMTDWVAGGPLPEGSFDGDKPLGGALHLGAEITLEDPAQGGAKVRYTNQEAQGEELERNLESGKQVTRLALMLDDRIGFVFGEDLVVRKLKYYETVIDKLDSVEAEDLNQELNARMIVLSAELASLFLALEPAFDLSPVEG